MPEDRPKRTRSWSEIDKQRDKSGGGRRPDRETESFQKSSRYTAYKNNLDRLFSGGAPLPEHLRDKLDPSGPGGEHDEERKKLYAIEETRAFYAAATAFLAKYPLPDDPRLLDRLLGHPDEDILEKALARLEKLQADGTLKAPPALRTRLSSVEIDSGDPRIRRRAAELRKALR